MSEDEIISLEIYKTIGVGRGPVGLEPIFQAIDEQLAKEQEVGMTTKVKSKFTVTYSNQFGMLQLHYDKFYYDNLAEAVQRMEYLMGLSDQDLLNEAKECGDKWIRDPVMKAWIEKAVEEAKSTNSHWLDGERLTNNIRKDK